ncbi:conserved hypothetical protein [Histoplasma capsulatum H143]|uniref:HNH nuclease domain-containing protein n=1 Tax=Ajellomyces capsulatus (strain H143) TaxID=544712 RepID=C6HEI8_AJECH|nr:conserved hypothetical protein [Histoplasma capsulatum H143]
MANMQMPPPRRPSSSSRQMSSEKSITSNGEFSEAIKLQTRAACGDRCWVCESVPADICHVFDRKDRYLEQYMREHGLLNFSLVSSSNAIPLCALCHQNFDFTSDPGFTFIPSDLSFFIEFEIADYNRRLRDAVAGLRTPRTCPTAEMYRIHQQSLLPADAIGGLYRCIMLRAYQPHLPSTVTDPLRSWHGAPIAALRRGILALGTMRIHRFPGDTVAQLQKLQYLYSRANPEPSQDYSDSPSRTALKHQSDPADSLTLPPKFPRLGASVPEPPSNIDESSWVLGPQSSAQDAVQRFHSVLINSPSYYL